MEPDGTHGPGRRMPRMPRAPAVGPRHGEQPTVAAGRVARAANPRHVLLLGGPWNGMHGK